MKITNDLLDDKHNSNENENQDSEQEREDCITFEEVMSEKKFKNSKMTSAKLAKNDEFYTSWQDIENEVTHYHKHFKDKVVVCNCDDPEYSNFWKYFCLYFKVLGLKKLIAIHYNPNGCGYVLIKNSHLGRPPEKRPLKGNGDFRSKEVIQLITKENPDDIIVVTNPPFSLFREFIAQLIQFHWKFLILGNNNAVAWRDIFKLIKQNKIWLGYSSNKTMEFRLADHYQKWDRIENGKKYGKVPAISWFTNLTHKKRNEEILLYKTYNPQDYRKYENYDAIEVSRVKDIPKDYEGVMGVPLTFFGSFNPNQFEIIGLGISSSGLEIGVRPYKPQHKKYRKEIQKRGTADGDLYMMVDGIVIVPYSRILIKKRK